MLYRVERVLCFCVVGEALCLSACVSVCVSSPALACTCGGRNFWKVLKMPALEMITGARTSTSSCLFRTVTPGNHHPDRCDVTGQAAVKRWMKEDREKMETYRRNKCRMVMKEEVVTFLTGGFVLLPHASTPKLPSGSPKTSASSLY